MFCRHTVQQIDFPFSHGKSGGVTFSPIRAHSLRRWGGPETAEVSTSVSCRGPAALSLLRSGGHSLSADCCGWMRLLHAASGCHTNDLRADLMHSHAHIQKKKKIPVQLGGKHTHSHCLCHTLYGINLGSAGYKARVCGVIGLQVVEKPWQQLAFRLWLPWQHKSNKIKWSNKL